MNASKMLSPLLSKERFPRHYGDDLLSTDKCLKFKWHWCRVASQFSNEEVKNWTHFQVSNCMPDKLWKLEAVLWHSGDGVIYEARINYGNNQIASKEGFKTRIDAQICAEKLLKDWILVEYKKWCGKRRGSKIKKTCSV
jgi:hypothetical protein